MTTPDSYTTLGGHVIREGDPVDANLARRLIALGFVPESPLLPATIGIHSGALAATFSGDYAHRIGSPLRVRLGSEHPLLTMLVVVRRIEIIELPNPNIPEDELAADEEIARRAYRCLDHPEFCIHGILSDQRHRHFKGEIGEDSPNDPRNWDIVVDPPHPVRLYITAQREPTKEPSTFSSQPDLPQAVDCWAQVIREPAGTDDTDASLLWSIETPPEAHDC